MIIAECRDYFRKELKALSRQMHAIEALLRENNVGNQSNEMVRDDLLPPLPLTSIQQFFDCENNLKMDPEMRKQFVSIFMFVYLLYCNFISHLITHFCNYISFPLSTFNIPCVFMIELQEHMICRIDGSMGKQFVRNSLTQIISNELGTYMTSTGQKSGITFKSTIIAKIIIGNIPLYLYPLFLCYLEIYIILALLLQQLFNYIHIHTDNTQ